MRMYKQILLTVKPAFGRITTIIRLTWSRIIKLYYRKNTWRPTHQLIDCSIVQFSISNSHWDFQPRTVVWYNFFAKFGNLAGPIFAVKDCKNCGQFKAKSNKIACIITEHYVSHTIIYTKHCFLQIPSKEITTTISQLFRQSELLSEWEERRVYLNLLAKLLAHNSYPNVSSFYWLIFR